VKPIVDTDEWLSYESRRYRFSGGRCVFCKRRHERMTTGVLPVIGPIWKCPECQIDYEEVRREKGVRGGADDYPVPVMTVEGFGRGTRRSHTCTCGRRIEG